MEEPRLRGMRFSPSELLRLLYEVKKHKEVLCKTSNNKEVNEEKNCAWKTIAKAVGSVDKLTPEKTAGQCKVKFRDLKQDCKAYLQKVKREGSNASQKPPFLATVLTIVGKDSPFWGGLSTGPITEESCKPVQKYSGVELMLNNMFDLEECDLDMSLTLISGDVEADVQAVADSSAEESKAAAEPSTSKAKSEDKPQGHQGSTKRRMASSVEDTPTLPVTSSSEEVDLLWPIYVMKRTRLVDEQLELVKLQKRYYSLMVKKLEREEEGHS